MSGILDFLNREEHSFRMGLLLMVLTAGILSGFSGSRILRASSNNHFAYLARSHLAGTTKMVDRRPHGNDWARVDRLELADGRVLQGSYWRTRGPNTFRTMDGGFVVVDPALIRKRSETWYVTFPPMPAWLMAPGVAIWGLAFNDVLFTVVFASLNAGLFWFLLVFLRKKKMHDRTNMQLLAFSVLFSFGTVNFFSSVRGEVWYTAHIVGQTFLILYVWSVFARKAFLAGLFLGAAFLCRTPLLFAGLLYPAWVWHEEGLSGIRRAWKEAVAFGVPVVAWLSLAMTINWVRFSSPFEFGHMYLHIGWRRRMETWGLFSLEYLSRNLSAMLTLLPRFSLSHPVVQISPHGMALWLTTPVFLLLFRPVRPHTFGRFLLWFGVIPVAMLSLLYQNSGFVQFGYRFSLDYTVLLILLLVLSGRKTDRWFWAFLAISVFVNAFGAATFGRNPAFYPGGSFFFFVT